jgi:hypothetical protein
MIMNGIRKRFARNDQNAKNNFLYQQTNDVLNTLVAAGAQFYYYCALPIMYVRGQVVNLFSRAAVLSALKQQLNIFDLAYARDTAEYFRYHAGPLAQVIPEGDLGTVNGIKEPEPTMTRFLRKSVREWLKEAIESGKLSQTNGEQNED